MKEEYIKKINEFMNKCDDIGLLDLILRLLRKCIHHYNDAI